MKMFEVVFSTSWGSVHTDFVQVEHTGENDSEIRRVLNQRIHELGLVGKVNSISSVKQC